MDIRQNAATHAHRIIKHATSHASHCVDVAAARRALGDATTTRTTVAATRTEPVPAAVPTPREDPLPAMGPLPPRTASRHAGAVAPGGCAAGRAAGDAGAASDAAAVTAGGANASGWGAATRPLLAAGSAATGTAWATLVAGGGGIAPSATPPVVALSFCCTAALFDRICLHSAALLISHVGEGRCELNTPHDRRNCGHCVRGHQADRGTHGEDLKSHHDACVRSTRGAAHGQHGGMEFRTSSRGTQATRCRWQHEV